MRRGDAVRGGGKSPIKFLTLSQSKKCKNKNELGLGGKGGTGNRRKNMQFNKIQI